MNTYDPVPPWLRLQYEEKIRHAVTGHDDVNTICGNARDVSRLYPWATTRDTANAIVNVLGTAYGAIYMHWAHRNAGRAAA